MFDVDRTLSMRAPEGEFAIMNFRTTRPFRPPFQVTAVAEVPAPGKIELRLRLAPTFPRDIAATGVLVRIAIPEEAARVHVSTVGRVAAVVAAAVALLSLKTQQLALLAVSS